MPSDCILCIGPGESDRLGRVLIWQDSLWRLSMSPQGHVAGFCYLEPRRHVRYITDLDGEEAVTFGATMAKVTNALKLETGCQLIYVYIFGGSVPHLHVHLAPHREGDVFHDLLLRGELETQVLPSGLVSIRSKDFPEAPASEHQAVAQGLRQRLASSS